ncbi:Phosphatidylinositide phosphatase SAC1 [Wickerhamomyces ciferrii]|uniref:Phosphatidylinositide phosphatase SAC1 n=1 Tax=Wickerhamomyces ciferrii (strain ATCC 14091 / BCRC 22168 / CBS 111 / JCM 3599 / NBRC 0793 / NRRL Y-1031 F-60-10) TaxID=1206466 RepID=K0KNZ9_WICCF|nr:Phosphatidylinositide phosphatase SAC1 [Wickerhamomyces ciferrii]CCH44691.1 Phosphatidylinositide phosphatase SAC1 [Wickerhamomyces ciferrii]
MADTPSSIVSSDQASAQIEYDHFLIIELYKDGLGLSLQNSNRSHFLRFRDLKFKEDYTPQGEPLATLNSLGLIGLVELGPGYLVVIHTQAPVFEHNEVTIWNITKCLVIPLKYDLAKRLFKFEETTGTNEEDQDANEETLRLQGRQRATSTASNLVTEKVLQTKDMFFSKLGVYVNDIKSNPSLSVSNKKVNMLTIDNEEDNEPEQLDGKEINSIKLKRSITIRGVPKDQHTQLPKNNFTRLFDKFKQQQLDESTNTQYSISNSLLFKFEKQLEKFFSRKDFFYSREIDVTKDIIYKDDKLQADPNQSTGSYWFNYIISKRFRTSGLSLPLIQGFIGGIDVDLGTSDTSEANQGKLLLLSKRSTKRAGSRYLRRGIDDQSNVANFVKTSQIFITELDNNSLFTKFDILRGSIPLFFQQNPAFLKPIPTLTRSIEKCQKPFKEHFENLLEKHGQVTCISLVERTPKENQVGNAYEELAHKNNIEFSWFDFHEICKKMKFDNVSQLLDYPVDNTEVELTVGQKLDIYRWTDNVNGEDQLGVLRINCIDCLDRTNIVSKFISEVVLVDKILPTHGSSIKDFSKFQKDFNNLWADNGDYISRQYASTNALKGDYTRTAKRNYKGLLNDAFLTMSRYYSGYISDYFKQCFVDYLLGHKNKDVFEEFENTLNVLDPNEINENLNKNNSTLKIIVEGLGIIKNKQTSSGSESEGEVDEDLILVGSWSNVQSPLVYNKLLPFDKDPISVILTNKLIYFVKYNEKDEIIEKVIKIKIKDLNELQYGAFITSTHSSLSLNPKRNVGLKFIFKKEFEATADNTENDQQEEQLNYLVMKFPSELDYEKIKYNIELISKTCHSSTLSNVDIIGEDEARKTVNVIENLEYRFKKLVWG